MRASARALALLLALGAGGGCDDRIDDKLVFDNPRDPRRAGLDDDGDGVANGSDECPLMGGEDLPDTGVCAGHALECPADKATDIQGYQANETLCDDLDNDCDGETDEAQGCQAGEGGEGEGGEGEGGGEAEGGGEGEGEGEEPVSPCGLCGICDVDGPQPLGGSCGRTEDCQPAVLTAEGYRECVHAQCGEGNCVDAVFCDRPCETADDCGDALDGPVGAQFECVRFGLDEPGVCRPGSNTRCESDADCDRAGELCVIDFAKDHNRSFRTCQARVKCGLAAGQACDTSLGAEAPSPCQGRFCAAGRCTGPCVNDDECLLPYDRCATDLVAIAGVSSDVLPICLGAQCLATEDCDEGQTCAVFVERQAEDEPPTLEGACVADRVGEGFVGLREACGNDPELGPDRQCAGGLCTSWNLLRSNSCRPMCRDEQQCEEGESCQEVPVCAGRDENGQCEWARGGVCASTPSPGDSCTATSDCPDGQACRALVTDASRPGFGPRDLHGDARCFDPGDRTERFQPCDGHGDCISGLCLLAGDQSACFPLCGGTAECTQQERCVTVPFNEEGTLAHSICTFAPNKGPACSPGDHSCADIEGAADDSYCSATPIAPTGAVENFCLTHPDGRPPGDPCEVGWECQSGHCWPGPDGGRCDRGCDDDDDCDSGYECLWTQLLDVGGPWPQAVAKRCRQARECTACGTGITCPEGMTCSYEDDELGGRKPVCLLDCENQDDCELSELEGDLICTVVRDKNGRQQQDKVCAPSNVQQCGWPGPDDGEQE